MTGAGAPIAEALVHADQGRGIAHATFQATSDADGSFVIGGLQPGNVQLFAHASGFANHNMDVEAGASDLVIRLDEAGAIAGRVVDEKGAPLESFRVIADNGEVTQGNEETFDAVDGTYTIEVEASGPASARVETGSPPATYHFMHVEIPDADTFTYDFRLGLSSVSGTVVGESTSQPIAQATVRLFDPDNHTGSGHVMTDSSGRFAIDAEPGKYRVSASREGYATAESDVSLGPAGVSDLTLALSRGDEIRGRVVDASGLPVREAIVSVASKPDRGAATVSLADGSFRVTGVPKGTHTLFAEAARRGFALRQGVEAPSENVVLTLQPGGRVRARVLREDGSAFVGSVWVVDVDGFPVNSDAGGTVGEDGWAELDTPPGNVTLAAWVRSAGEVGRATVAVAAGQTVQAEIRASAAPKKTPQPAPSRRSS